MASSSVTQLQWRSSSCGADQGPTSHVTTQLTLLQKRDELRTQQALNMFLPHFTEQLRGWKACTFAMCDIVEALDYWREASACTSVEQFRAYKRNHHYSGFGDKSHANSCLPLDKLEKVLESLPCETE